ncbi:MAG: hypothetical protein NVV83_20745 [Afipia sp.]|jgi:hypothetical protein|nr:hypothetical protein [Afipia sp.]
MIAKTPLVEACRWRMAGSRGTIVHEQEIASFIQNGDKLMLCAVTNALLALAALIPKDTRSMDH